MLVQTLVILANFHRFGTLGYVREPTELEGLLPGLTLPSLTHLDSQELHKLHTLRKTVEAPNASPCYFSSDLNLQC